MAGVIKDNDVIVKSPNAHFLDGIPLTYLTVTNIKTNFDYSEISLTNVIGKEIFKSTNQNIELINLSDEPNGIYFLKIKTNQEVLIRKIIISK